MVLVHFRLALLPLACALAAACTGPSAVGTASPGLPEVKEAPEAVLSRFVDAIDAGRWAQARALLSARWRAGYTPSRLEADFAGAGPMAREAGARVQAALRAGTPFRIEDGRASLPLAGGTALLLAEEGGWRVDALE